MIAWFARTYLNWNSSKIFYGMKIYTAFGTYVAVSCIALVANKLFPAFFYSLIVFLMPFNYGGQHQSNIVIVLFATLIFPLMLLPVYRIPGLFSHSKIKEHGFGNFILYAVVFVGVWSGCFAVALKPAELLRSDVAFIMFVAGSFLSMHLLSSAILLKLKEFF